MNRLAESSLWPATEVKLRPIGDIKPSPRNVRLHSERQIDQIRQSLRDYGWTTPVLVDEDGQLIAGHGRLEAAKREGITEVPVAVAAGWTEAQRRAYALADNKIALNSTWDEAALGIELGELTGLGVDLGTLGFDDAEVAALSPTGGHEGLTDPDDVPEAAADAVSTRGDLWALGCHRLICDDATDAAAVHRLMCGAAAELCFTSPPYAQQRDYGAAAAQVRDWDKLMQGVFGSAPLAPSGQLLVNLGLVHRDGEWVPYWDGWIEWMRGQGWRRFGWYVWDKLAGLPGDWQGRLAPSHEWIFHLNRAALKPNKTKEKKPESIEFNSHGSGLRGKNGKMSGVSNRAASMQTHKIPDSVFRIVPHKARGGPNATHPAMFPVSLAEEGISAFSLPGQCVYEPFSGSGTTIIAAERTGRNCHAIEIDPLYVDVAVRRWQDFTGQKATLDGDGRTFEEIAAERARAAA